MRKEEEESHLVSYSSNPERGRKRKGKKKGFFFPDGPTR